ncbi:MAG: hypothetical protein K0S23_3501 [Fluviicola sp.]|jgi:hypothetical protein|uniref:hypothetical protein n=1 Tax=Fluviicola sp. TaxID=1917219 RepID=UPI00260A33B2|nr:hypothetical protein [Fluviicola sp.]MDF3029194.1 hypothetical protein [Fluviicola sp.]
MKNTAKLLLVLSLFALGFTGCSKEKRIERHLVRKEGKWNVDTYDYKYYYNNTFYPNESFTYSAAGNFVFEKNGTYVWTTIMDGDTDVSAGTWENTADELTLVQNSFALKFKILEESKKEMKLEYTDSDGIEKEVYTLTLKKD